MTLPFGGVGNWEIKNDVTKENQIGFCFYFVDHYYYDVSVDPITDN
jgi:hypothetical protein